LYKKVVPIEIRKMRTTDKMPSDSKNKRNPIDDNSNTEIKELWSWVKSLVRFQETTLNRTNNLDTQKNNYSTNSNIANLNDLKNLEYEAICTKIMKENCLNSTKELKQFLDKSITNLLSNRKKVDKIKELLFKEPVSKDKILTNMKSANSGKI
jgi:hypothetical protein